MEPAAPVEDPESAAQWQCEVRGCSRAVRNFWPPSPTTLPHSPAQRINHKDHLPVRLGSLFALTFGSALALYHNDDMTWATLHMPNYSTGLHLPERHRPSPRRLRRLRDAPAPAEETAAVGLPVVHPVQ